MLIRDNLTEIGTTITTIYKSIQDNIQDNKQVMGDILYEVRELGKHPKEFISRDVNVADNGWEKQNQMPKMHSNYPSL